MTDNEKPVCGVTKTLAEKQFKCILEPHPRTPGDHYFCRTNDLESTLEEVFRKTVEELGGIAIKMVPALTGVPDRLVIFPPGEVILVELKATDGRVSKIQDYQHKKLRRLGAKVEVIYGREGVIRWAEARRKRSWSS